MPSQLRWKAACAGGALALGIAGLTSSAGAQAVPECAPDKVLTVELKTEERGLKAPLIATHDASVIAEFSDDAQRSSVLPPPGTRILNRNGTGVRMIVPVGNTVPITVSWYQASDPSDPESDASDPATRCAASRTIALPVTPARRSRAVYNLVPPYTTGLAVFAVVPALKAPDLSPLKVTSRVASRARFPSPRSKGRSMTVPMGAGELVKYGKPLPNLAYVTTKVKCKVFLLTCGRIFTEVSALGIDTDALQRGIEKGDLHGGQRLLARTQPRRTYARYGIAVDVHPGGGGEASHGFDVQVRQSGRLLARVRSAARCRSVSDGAGKRYECRITRRSTKLR